MLMEGERDTDVRENLLPAETQTGGYMVVTFSRVKD